MFIKVLLRGLDAQELRNLSTLLPGLRKWWLTKQWKCGLPRQVHQVRAQPRDRQIVVSHLLNQGMRARKSHLRSHKVVYSIHTKYYTQTTTRRTCDPRETEYLV